MTSRHGHQPLRSRRVGDGLTRAADRAEARRRAGPATSQVSRDLRADHQASVAGRQRTGAHPRGIRPDCKRARPQATAPARVHRGAPEQPRPRGLGRIREGAGEFDAGGESRHSSAGIAGARGEAPGAAAHRAARIPRAVQGSVLRRGRARSRAVHRRARPQSGRQPGQAVEVQEAAAPAGGDAGARVLGAHDGTRLRIPRRTGGHSRVRRVPRRGPPNE